MTEATRSKNQTLMVSDPVFQSHDTGQGHPESIRRHEAVPRALAPDLVVLIEVDTPLAGDRLGGDLDRIEQAGNDLQAAVGAAYRQMATADPDRWVVVDGTGPIEEVADRVATAVDQRLS